MPKAKKADLEDPITLINFKIENNISDLTYAGLKADLNATDETEMSKTDLEKALQAYEEKPAFKEVK